MYKSDDAYAGLGLVPTQKLWDPAASSWRDGVTRSRESPDKPPWPRSFSSDGYVQTLVVHLLFQIGSFAALAVAVMHVRSELKLHIVDVVCALAVGAHALAVVTLVVSSLLDVWVTNNILATSLTAGGYTLSLPLTGVLVACSIRSDDDMTLGLAWGIAALCLEAAAVGMWVACVVNLCALGGRVYTQPLGPNEPGSLEENKKQRAEANDF